MRTHFNTFETPNFEDVILLNPWKIVGTILHYHSSTDFLINYKFSTCVRFILSIAELLKRFVPTDFFSSLLNFILVHTRYVHSAGFLLWMLFCFSNLAWLKAFAKYWCRTKRLHFQSIVRTPLPKFKMQNRDTLSCWFDTIRISSRSIWDAWPDAEYALTCNLGFCNP